MSKKRQTRRDVDRRERKTLFVSHLECSACSRSHAAGRPANLCESGGRPLLVRYDLEATQRAVAKD